MNTGDAVFVGYPWAVQYQEKGEEGSPKGTTAINQLLWGDWARVTAVAGDWVQINSRNRQGWVRRENLQAERILEVGFVDVGQGDGCHIQTPRDRALIIDAGVDDNMYRFLKWRFGRFRQDFSFESFLITHPDKDHYQGFAELFAHPKVHVGTVYHNTLVEQKTGGKSSLGDEQTIDKTKYLTGLVQTGQELRAITHDPARSGGRNYPTMLKQAMDSGRVGDFVGLLASPDWTQPRYLPGYGPEDGQGFTLKILGPVPREISPGRFALRRLGSHGYTKNGHSMVLLLTIGQFRILLGGDLNEPSQKHLLAHYTGLDPDPKTPAELETLISEGRKHFQVDVAKACHHGSSDISPTFLAATNPLATVVCSGDDEPHSHPRPDALGLIGKTSRSDRPLIFSTELARSGNEAIKHPNQVKAELRATMQKLYDVINSPTATEQQKAKADEDLEECLGKIQRSVANYGMINLRTDGRRMIIAMRLERKRSKSQRWDIYQFEPDSRGRVLYLP